MAKTRPSRELQRVRERRARERRIENLDAMYRHVRLLEQAQVALLVFPDDDSSWCDFMDDEAHKSMMFYRQFIEINAAILRLRAENGLLQRLLTEKMLASRVIEGMLSKAALLDEWSRKVAQWRMLSERYYRPLTMGDFDRYVRASLQEKQQSELDADTPKAETKIRGWADNRRVVQETHTFRFTARKVLQNVDPRQVKDHIWSLYADPEVYAKVVLGGRGDSSLDLQQQLSPNAQVMRCFEVYDQHLALTVQYMCLQFRVQTDKGLVQFFRTLSPDEVSPVISDEASVWPTIFFWIQIETLTSRDVRVSAGGRIHSEDPAFTNYWCIEELGIVLRSEEILTGKPLLRF